MGTERGGKERKKSDGVRRSQGIVACQLKKKKLSGALIRSPYPGSKTKIPITLGGGGMWEIRGRTEKQGGVSPCPSTHPGRLKEMGKTRGTGGGNSLEYYTKPEVRFGEESEMVFVFSCKRTARRFKNCTDNEGGRQARGECSVYRVVTHEGNPIKEWVETSRRGKKV